MNYGSYLLSGSSQVKNFCPNTASQRSQGNGVHDLSKTILNIADNGKGSYQGLSEQQAKRFSRFLVRLGPAIETLLASFVGLPS
jgi:hypothetical protein